MKRLMTVKQIAERYQCGLTTARKYMRQMVHMESPLMVTEQAVEDWESRKTYEPIGTQRTRQRTYTINRRRAIK